MTQNFNYQLEEHCDGDCSECKECKFVSFKISKKPVKHKNFKKVSNVLYNEDDEG